MAENQEKTGLTLEQKFGFVFLLIFAVLFLVLSFFQLRNNLYRPYALSNAVPSTLIKEKFSDPTEALHYRDTDKDGLNDFEEIYIYDTSAYLEDTDSDGIKDKEEILQGKNPICAEGSSCNQESGETKTEQILESWIKDSQSEGYILNPADYFNDPVQIKKILISSGISEDLLVGVTDEELKQIGQEVFNSVEFKNALNTQLSGSGQGTSTTMSKEELFANPTLLREMLLNTGYIEKTALEKLSDEEVKKVAEQMFDFSQ
ncbi:MAG TPA: hypothetical protein P5230_03285 [Candidatus Magasanikbacteria bacterium]|nr:hypothetical protein [Candidatus Magasanikbacteria bacterium]